MSVDAELKEGRFVKSGNLGFPDEQILEKSVLKDGTFVKKVAQITIVDHKTKGRRVESITIDEYRRKKKTDPWPNEPTRIALSHDALDELVKYLLAQDEFLKLQRSTRYTLLTGATDLSQLRNDEIEALVSLVKNAANSGKLSEVVKLETINNIAAAIQQTRYKDAVNELKTMLSNKLSEEDYREWFLAHPWVFGTEYLKPESNRQIGWKVKGDIILTSVDGYQDIIELKLPSAKILIYDNSHDNWYPSADLTLTIAQVVKYIHDSEDDRTTIALKEKLPFLKPRARIVIGRSNDWDGKQNDALRRFNSALHSIQIMTYDHLLISASRMIQYYEGH